MPGEVAVGCVQRETAELSGRQRVDAADRRQRTGAVAEAGAPGQVADRHREHRIDITSPTEIFSATESSSLTLVAAADALSVGVSIAPVIVMVTGFVELVKLSATVTL